MHLSNKMLAMFTKARGKDVPELRPHAPNSAAESSAVRVEADAKEQEQDNGGTLVKRGPPKLARQQR